MNSSKSKIPVFAVNPRNQTPPKWTESGGPQRWPFNKRHGIPCNNIITSTPISRNFELPIKNRYQPKGEGPSAPARIPRHRNLPLPNYTTPSFSGSPGAGFLVGDDLSPIEADILDVGSPSPGITDRDPWANEGDESLGLLTPEQMAETSLHLGEAAWPDMDLSETRDSLLENQSFPDFLYATIPSEDTLVLEQNIDAHSKLSTPESTRADLTLSPEDPPIDIVPSIVHMEGEQATIVPNSNAASTSFITSVTSIASLDNGYQGDGEFSRPGSRGASLNAVLPPQPILQPLPIVAQQSDPMTDSDFFTESDLDGHEDGAMAAAAIVQGSAVAIPGTRIGDRRAQVIDGTLYGSINTTTNNHNCASFITSSTTEEMDSSGVYSDLDKRPNDDMNAPSTSSSLDNSSRSTSQRSQLIIDNSQSLSSKIGVIPSITYQRSNSLEEAPKKPSNTQTKLTKEIVKNTVNQQNNKDEHTRSKKFPMPKRKVESKIKLLIEKGRENEPTETRRPKTGGRWDVVMNKIALGQAENKYKPNRLKQVKSKVFASIESNDNITINNNRINSCRPSLQNVQRNGNDISLKNKRSRVRIRTTSCSHDSITISGQSSTSDLSAAPSSAPITSTRLGAKPAPSISTLQSKNSKSIVVERKNGQATLRPANTKRYPPTPIPARGVGGVGTEAKRQAGAAPPRNIGAAATSKTNDVNVARSQWEKRYLPRLEYACAGFDAMTVLVQYLVTEFNAFETPKLKQQILKGREEFVKAKLEYDELFSTQLLERKSSEQRLFDRDQLHRDEIRQLKIEFDNRLKDLEKELSTEQASRNDLESSLYETKRKLKETEGRLEEVTSRFTETETKYITASAKLSEAEAKIIEIQSRIQGPPLPPPPSPPPAINHSKWIEFHNEISSLKTVLELKQKEIHGLRQANIRITLEAERVPTLEQRITGLQARVEDLALQLERKTTLERQLSLENRALGDSLQQTSQQRDRLTQDKESLQWKLKQNLDMYNMLAEISGPEAVTAAASAVAQLHTNCERTESLQGMNSSSAHMKGLVHKADSVSWVLDINESAESILNRLVRRAGSFRSGSTSPPSNFTSPVHSTSLAPAKRQRQRLRPRHLRTKTTEDWTNETADETMEANTSSVSVAGALPMDSNPGTTGSDGSSGSSPTPQETARLLEARTGMCALQEAGGEAMISEETSDEEHHNYSDEDHFNIRTDQNSHFVKETINTSPSSLEKIDDF